MRKSTVLSLPPQLVLSVECHFAECHFAKFHYAECHYAECHCTECHYAECHYTECHYAECNAIMSTFSGQKAASSHQDHEEGSSPGISGHPKPDPDAGSAGRVLPGRRLVRHWSEGERVAPAVHLRKLDRFL
jgi:hypothetical protein